MKDVSVSLDDEITRWARVEAAKRHQSLPRYIAELLWAEWVRCGRMQEAAVSYHSRSARPLKDESERYPERGELYAG